MASFDDELKAALDDRLKQQRYRQRTVSSSPQDARVTVDGKPYLAFANNDYLGLANHPNVVSAFQQAAIEHGVGSGASHLVYGHTHHHHTLENSLARFTGRERALLFSTGYMANMGVISALAGRGDSVYQDRLNHASLIDAGIVSRATMKRYRHNDLKQLEYMLSKDTAKRKFVVVDGVFSMDGDIAPLPALSLLCHRYGAQLMVDDAHGFGVLGGAGGGCAEHFQLSVNELPILVGTLGKAFGTFGAFVAGSATLIETLIQFARPYIYTTALPPAVAAATCASLSLLESDTHRRKTLHRTIHYFREGATALALPLMESQTPIQPIVLGSDTCVLRAANHLRENGVLVGAIRPPTVPEGTGRLRITLNANHSKADVDRLLELLADVFSSGDKSTSLLSC
ncbi:MAG: 8-amino-7-oxononanoate synthase [Candidatus Endobugula sp.]|jgi:8-amino-7-oxononanoate synthase